MSVEWDSVYVMGAAWSGAVASSTHSILSRIHKNPNTACTRFDYSLPFSTVALVADYKLIAMSRVFCVPAIFFLFSAFVLLFIVSISLPFLSAMDITRVHTSSGNVKVAGDQDFTQLRVSCPYHWLDLR